MFKHVDTPMTDDEAAIGLAPYFRAIEALLTTIVAARWYDLRRPDGGLLHPTDALTAVACILATEAAERSEMERAADPSAVTQADIDALRRAASTLERVSGAVITQRPLHDYHESDIDVIRLSLAPIAKCLSPLSDL